jgi:hypothetical protein
VCAIAYRQRTPVCGIRTPVSIFYRDRARVEHLAPPCAPVNDTAPPVDRASHVRVHKSYGTRGPRQSLPTWFVDRPKDAR